MPPHRSSCRFRHASAALAILVLSVSTASVVCGVGPTDAQPAESETPPNAELQALDPYLGLWDVIETHFDARGVAGVVVKGTETVLWTLDRHAVRRTYRTRTDESVFEAVCMLTWSDGAKKYVGVWLNNVSTTGPTTVEGEWSSDRKSMIFTLDSRAKDGSALRYRVVDEWRDDRSHVATTYRIDGEKVTKLMEVRYVRTVPCPGGARIITGEFGG